VRFGQPWDLVRFMVQAKWNENRDAVPDGTSFSALLLSFVDTELNGR